VLVYLSNIKKQTMTFQKQNFNESVITKEDYITKFNALGFNPTKVEISFTNGCSAYISLNVEVINEGKMYADVFVYDSKATLQVRVSDHASNLERICGGVCGNKLSFEAFKTLVDNNVIK
jgi:hypothetical protein